MSRPKVSIGMPVRNGENFLAETLSALLSQTMLDLEIVVSDNYSQDGTPDILSDFARRDPRVKFSRTKEVIRPADNHTRAFEMSSGEYFKFAAHDDTHLPTFLERCLDVLEHDAGVVLVYPRVDIINSKGAVIKNYRYRLNTDASTPSARFGALVRANHRIHGAYEIYGLARMSSFRSIPPQGNYPRADSVMLARFASHGRFHEIPEVLFLSREHEKRSVRQIPGQVVKGRSRLAKFIGQGPVPSMEWWDSKKKGAITFPEWRVALEYLRSIGPAPIPAAEKLKCYLEMLRWFLPVGSLKLTRDLIIAGEQVLAG
jgi:glycosyltransferase involved in cell wall biosynthesis